MVKYVKKMPNGVEVICKSPMMTLDELRDFVVLRDAKLKQTDAVPKYEITHYYDGATKKVFPGV